MKQIVYDNGFGRGFEFIGNKDVNVVIIFHIPASKNDYKLHGYLTIFQFGLKWIGFIRDFTSIRGFVFNGFDLMWIMLFDEGNELIWFDKTPFFLNRMVHEDISVRFYLREEDFSFCVNMFKKACCSIPWVEGNTREIKGFKGLIKEFFCNFGFVFKQRIGFSAGKFTRWKIRDYVDGKMFCLWDEGNTDATIADFFPFKWSTVLPLSTLGFLCKGFWTSCIIDGKKSIFSGGCSSLLLNDFESSPFDGLNIPFWVGEEILEFLIIRVSCFSHNLKWSVSEICLTERYLHRKYSNPLLLLLFDQKVRKCN